MIACVANVPVGAEEVDHQLHRGAGVPIARRQPAVHRVVAQVVQPTQLLDVNGELQTRLLRDGDVGAERGPLADSLLLALRQLVDQLPDVSAEDDFERGGGVDDRSSRLNTSSKGGSTPSRTKARMRAHCSAGRGRMRGVEIWRPKAESLGGSMKVRPAPTAWAS